MKRTCLLLAAALMLSACTSDQVTVSLEAAVDAAIAADAIARPQDAPYLTLATGCLDQAETILAGTGTPAIKAAQVSAACAAAVAAQVNAPVSVQAVSAALNVFLSHVQQLSAQVQFSNPRMVAAFAGSPAAKPSKARLAKIRKKLDRLKAHSKKGATK
jgi:hypothetical protein